MHRLRTHHGWLGVALLALTYGACGGSSSSSSGGDDDDSPNGGTPSSGGTGGTPSTGGASVTGGTPATGGTGPAGGQPSTGGTTPTGGVPSTGGTSSTGGSAGRDDACNGDAEDCAWGEIYHEILAVEDCPCLLGCPTIPQSVETVERRQAQYQALCTPGQNGRGMPCPIDDCIVPPPLACIDGTCRGPR